MKNLKIKWGNLAYNVGIALIVALVFMISPLYAIGASLVIGVLLGFAPQIRTAVFYMAVQKEIWTKDIEEDIFKDNQFLNFAFNADENVVGGAIVHIPQSGGAGNVVKNRTALPANIRKRNDTDVLYALDEFTTDPVLIPNADNYELSYDKRDSVLGEDRQKLTQTIAEEMIYNWLNSPVDPTATLPANKILLTSGALAPATGSGATGTRKIAGLNDLQAVATSLRNENRWFEGKMNALLPASMLAEMFPADSVTTATYMNQVSEQERRSGILYKAQGFNILSRSSVVACDNAGVIKAPGTAGAATDDEAALFWYTNAVERALGEILMFEQLGVPTMYGDVYSFLVRMGGRARRAAYEGIRLLKKSK